MKKSQRTFLCLLTTAWLAVTGLAVTSPEPALTLRPRAPLVVDVPDLQGNAALRLHYDPFFALPVEGITETEVLSMLGRPSERRASWLWIYWNYHSQNRAAAAGGYDTLVVAFAQGKVVRMKLVDGKTLREALTRPLPLTATTASVGQRPGSRSAAGENLSGASKLADPR